MRLCVDDGHGIAQEVGDEHAIARGRDGKTAGASRSGNRLHLVSGGLNHVHCPLVIARDVGEAEIVKALFLQILLHFLDDSVSGFRIGEAPSPFCPPPCDRPIRQPDVEGS